MARNSFGGDIAKFAKRQNMTLDQAHRGISISLYTSVVMDTPVEEGQLRGNWNVSTGSPDDSTNAGNDPSGAATVGAIKTHRMKAGDVTYLTNAMPYAEVAELGQWNGPTAKVTSAGFSRKAPAGMVRKNFARIEAIVRSETQKARRKK